MFQSAPALAVAPRSGGSLRDTGAILLSISGEGSADDAARRITFTTYDSLGPVQIATAGERLGRNDGGGGLAGIPGEGEGQLIKEGRAFSVCHLRFDICHRQSRPIQSPMNIGHFPEQ